MLWVGRDRLEVVGHEDAVADELTSVRRLEAARTRRDHVSDGKISRVSMTPKSNPYGGAHPQCHGAWAR
jgi:hypothetical protein